MSIGPLQENDKRSHGKDNQAKNAIVSRRQHLRDYDAAFSDPTPRKKKERRFSVTFFFRYQKKVVQERAPELYPLVAHLATPQFVHFFRGMYLEELSKGVPIGSGIASFVSCLVEERVMERLMEKAGPLILDLKAYIDNMFFFARAQDVEKILGDLVEVGNQMACCTGSAGRICTRFFFRCRRR